MRTGGRRKDPISLDVANAALWRGHERVGLRPKDLDVLRHLLARRGRLVPKADLMEAAWPGVTVADGVLKVCINRLRAALRDDARRPWFIETVHRRGYRLVGDIALLDGSGGVTSAAPAGESPNLLGSGRVRADRIVGREAELSRLQGHFARAMAGTRQVVFVSGEAGLGKTTLIDAFLESLGGRRSPPRVRLARGECVEHYGAGEAYLPVLEALGRLARGRDGRVIVAHLDRHAPTWLVQIPGLVPSAEREALARRTAGATRERMLRELADALDVLTRTLPLVLVLEDLHWSDVSTLDLVGTLARRRASARLLVLGTYRPEDVLPRGHPLPTLARDLSLHGLAVELPLPPLSLAAVETYLDARFPGAALPPGLGPAVHRRTDGHPLFLAAMADHWTVHGMLVESGGRWETRAELETLGGGVPADVRQMIEVRLVRLAAGERRLVETASVAGLEFAAASVAAALDEPLAEIDERCAALARRGLLLRSLGEERWPDGTVAGRYGFVHALYRDVIREQIPVARRVDLHRRVAMREECGYGAAAGRIAARLAMHFAEAGDFLGAARHRLQAARNAVERGGYHEAIAQASAGLEALGALPREGAAHDRTAREQTVDLHLVLRQALLPLGQHRRILDHLRQAAALAETLDDPSRLGRACAYLAEYSRQAGEPRRGVDYAERALALATAATDLPLQVLANYYLGAVCLDVGDYRRAMECLRHNVTALVGDWQHERFGTPGVVSVMSRARFSSCAAELGAFAEGAAMAEEAVRIAEAVDHPFSLTQACFGFGDLHAQRGDLPVAIRALERGLHLCRVANIHTWSPTVAAALGHAYALSGRVAEALPLLQEAVERADAMGVSAGQSRRLVSLSTACLLGGRVAEAAALADRALEVARDLGARGYEAHALCHLGDVHVRRNGLDVEAAEAAYQQALGLAGQLGMRPLQARCHLGLGIVYRRTGRGDQARDALAGAVGLFREMAMRFWLPRAEDELAQARAPA